MTVWTVEDGAYSDYHIVGVYSTREGAEEIVAVLGCGEIVERECDVGLAKIRAGLHLYLVQMRRDGHVERCERQDLSSYDLIGDPMPSFSLAGSMVVEMFARDETEAVKAANEKRAQMIALGQWPEPAQEPG